MASSCLNCDSALGLQLLRQALRAGLTVTRTPAEALILRGARHGVTRELLAGLKENKPSVVATLRSGERLLNSLWAAGFRVRLAPSESQPEGVFLLPVGNPRLTQEHLEALFEAYERDQEAALLTLLGRLPKDSQGRPDWQKWNEMAERYHCLCSTR